jgi:hypothetical protein
MTHEGWGEVGRGGELVQGGGSVHARGRVCVCEVGVHMHKVGSAHAHEVEVHM